MALANIEGGKIVVFFIITIFMCVIGIGLNVNAQSKNVPLNEYGLKVIGTKKYYLEGLKTDTTQKMVLLERYVSPLQTTWVYATPNNFTHQILYKKPKAYLRLPAALALQKVADTLKKLGIGIKIFDAYRPYSVTKKMWQIVPDDNYAADPAKGSGHNRGIAVDLTLVDLNTGKELLMPTAFDNFTDSAHNNFMQLDAVILQNRTLLKNTMEQYGFVALPTEWWHYSLPNPKNYDLLDFDFRTLHRLVK